MLRMLLIRFIDAKIILELGVVTRFWLLIFRICKIIFYNRDLFKFYVSFVMNTHIKYNLEGRFKVKMY